MRMSKPEVPCHFCPDRPATRFFLPIDANGNVRFCAPLYIAIHRCAECVIAWRRIGEIETNVPGFTGESGEYHGWFREVDRAEAILHEVLDQ